jgi:hypothetical protein
VVGSTEITTGIPNNRDVEVLQRLQYILSETILIGKWTSRLVDASIDASTHMPKVASAYIVSDIMPCAVWQFSIDHTYSVKPA